MVSRRPKPKPQGNPADACRECLFNVANVRRDLAVGIGTVLLALVGQSAAAIWWASNIDTRMNFAERQLETMAAQLDKLHSPAPQTLNP